MYLDNLDLESWEAVYASILNDEGTFLIQSFLDRGLDINCLNDTNGTTMISFAAQCGNLEIVQFLVFKGADPNAENFNGSKPMHIAASFGHPDVVNFLLNIGISADICDDNERTPFHYIAAKRDIASCFIETVHVLLDRNADINAADHKGITPILLAAQNSHRHLVELFIALGANLDTPDDCNLSVLQHACRRGWLGIVQSIVDRRSEMDLKVGSSDGHAPEVMAAQFHHTDIVILLVDTETDIKCIDYWSHTLLHYACERGWLDVVKSLAKKGCDLNAKNGDGRTPVYMAASHSFLHVVDYLHNKKHVRIDDDDGYTLLDYACNGGWLEVARYFVRSGCDIYKKSFLGKTLWFLAAYRSRQSVVEFLIDCMDNVTGCDENGWSLLHYACREGWFDMVKSLLEKGCDLNGKCTHGITPLLRAARCGHCRIVAFLIDRGADVECDEVGWTVLHYACAGYERGGWLEVVTTLTSKVSDINVQTFSNSTPLHLAAEKCNLEIVKHLLTIGASCSLENTRGKTAFSIFIHSASNTRLELILLFLTKGAYFEIDDYTHIMDNPGLKEGILQNHELCTMALINKYNCDDLRRIYEVPSISAILPPIQELKIAMDESKINGNSVAMEISERVKFEIETKGYCDLSNAQPIFLRKLCLKSINQYYELRKRKP